MTNFAICARMEMNNFSLKYRKNIVWIEERINLQEGSVRDHSIRNHKGWIMVIVWFIILILLLLALLGIIGISWYISNRLLHRTGSAPSLSIPVTDVGTKTITLQKTANTKRPGVFGITGADGQAIVGPILSSDAETVTRELIHSTGVLSNAKVAWNTTVYGGALRDHLELTINDVRVPGTLGDMPAWYVPGKLDTWAILVHGATGTQEQGLRAFRTLADLGLPILDITYRNDKGAPSSSDGLSHLGDTEWQDVETSVKYALEQGAQHILLYGWSLGGTIVETFLDRSSYVSSIQAVVLDSPILNWHATLDALTKKNTLPPFIARVTEKVISMRTGIRFDVLDQVGQDESQIPILLFHGIGDTTAPIVVSDTFASAHSNVMYHRVADAEHTQCWNADHQVYEAELRAFVTRVLELMVI